MSLNQAPPHDNDYSGQANGDGHDDGRKRARQASDYWITCTQLYAKCQSVGAEIISLRRAVVREEGARGYKRIVGAIRITKTGAIECSGCVTLTDDEKKAMAAEAAAVKFPKSVPAPKGSLPPALEGVDPKDYYVFRNAEGEVLFIEHRIPPKTEGGKKQCLPWTFFEDGQWRGNEPDGLLPLFGLDHLAQATAKIKTVYLHEGPKAARKWQEMTAGPNDELTAHPWGDILKLGAHVGWAGGALRPHDTDWEPLKNLPPDVLIVMICDNDQPGKAAARFISRTLKRRMTVVMFDKMFPEGFDLADGFDPDDPWPQHEDWWSKKDGKKDEYKGPTLMDHERPATWATDTVSTGKQGRPSHMLLSEFADEWVYAAEQGLFIHLNKPHFRFSESVFDAVVNPFSDLANTSKLLKAKVQSQVISLTYKPGKIPGVITDGGIRQYNIFLPSDIKPKHGDQGLWLEYMKHLIPHEGDRHHLMRWCATLIARPGIKMRYGVLLVSEMQGVGKTTLGQEILAPLVGKHNVSNPSENTIASGNFNGWVAKNRLAIVNEIYSGKSSKAYNNLKTIISDTTVSVNEKHEKEYDLENFIHIFACSNSMRAIRLDSTDRRFFIPAVAERTLSHDWWKKFHAWLEDGGIAIIRQWADDYVHKHGEIQEGEHPPMSGAKKDMIAESRTEGLKAVVALAEAAMEMKEQVILVRSEVRAWAAAMRGLLPGDPRMEGADNLFKEMKAVGMHEPERLAVSNEKPRYTVGGSKEYIISNQPIPSGKLWEDLHKQHKAPGSIMTNKKPGDACPM